MYIHIAITGMTSGGKIVGFLLRVHVYSQLEDSSVAIKFVFMDQKHGQAVNLFVNCKQQDFYSDKMTWLLATSVHLILPLAISLC